MGEYKAVGESIVGNLADNACLVKNHHSPTVGNALYLCSFSADNHIPFCIASLRFDKCKFTSALKSLTGEEKA